MIQNKIRDFLSQDISTHIRISSHCSGFRVTIHTSRFGETSFDTGPNLEQMILGCIERHNSMLSIRKESMIEELEKEKKDLEREMSRLSRDIESLK